MAQDNTEFQRKFFGTELYEGLKADKRPFTHEEYAKIAKFLEENPEFKEVVTLFKGRFTKSEDST